MNRQEDTHLSDEKLNAYIDDELHFEERTRIVELLERDTARTHEAQELRQLQAMLRHAYREPPPAPRQGTERTATRASRNAIAAGLLLTFGILAGWYGNAYYASDTMPSLAAYDHEQPLTVAVAAQENLLLHISSNDPARMEATLNYAEQALDTARRNHNEAFRLEVVANDGGVEMLHQHTSPFAQRIERLLSQHENVSVLACANALRKLRERGVKVELLPGTQSDHTAIDEIINRLEGGWRYLKV